MTEPITNRSHFMAIVMDGNTYDELCMLSIRLSLFESVQAALQLVRSPARDTLVRLTAFSPFRRFLSLVTACNALPGGIGCRVDTAP